MKERGISNFIFFAHCPSFKIYESIPFRVFQDSAYQSERTPSESDSEWLHPDLTRHANDFPTESHTRASLLVRLQRLKIPATEPRLVSTRTTGTAGQNNHYAQILYQCTSVYLRYCTSVDRGRGGGGCRRLAGGSEPSHAVTAVTYGD